MERALVLGQTWARRACLYTRCRLRICDRALLLLWQRWQSLALAKSRSVGCGQCHWANLICCCSNLIVLGKQSRSSQCTTNAEPLFNSLFHLYLKFITLFQGDGGLKQQGVLHHVINRCVRGRPGTKRSAASQPPLLRPPRWQALRSTWWRVGTPSRPGLSPYC